MSVLKSWLSVLLLSAALQGGTVLAETGGPSGSVDCQALVSQVQVSKGQGSREQARRISCQLGTDEGSSEALLAGIDRLQRKGVSGIDLKAGLTLTGQGSGGLGAISRSVDMPDKFLRGLVTTIDAQRIPADSGSALALFSAAARSGANKNITYRLSGSALEPFFRSCEQWLVACMGSWSNSGAMALSSPPPARLDQILPIFSAFSANQWGANGHYNLGLQFQAEATVVNSNGVIVPLRYVRSKQQPARATFNLTLRRLGPFSEHKGKNVSWELFGTEHKGTALLAKDGSLTLKDLSLTSSEQYTSLLIHVPKPSWQLVYTRQPRAREPVAGTPIMEAANWQHASDVGRINGGLAEADVVIDDLNGRVKVIHDCTKSKENCVAHEARVSPDGTKIVYSVGYGNQLNEVIYEGMKLGIKEIPGLTYAEIWLYDMKTGVSKAIAHHPPGAIDRQPDWLNNERIVFASNRANMYPPRNQFSMHRGLDQYGQGRCFNAPYCVSQEYGYGHTGKSMQIWEMNIDGTNARNLTPHEGNALAPAVMSNGDILYSCWNAQENKSFDAHGRTASNPGTSKNKWWLCRMDGNGGDGTVILNGHKTTTIKTKEWLPGRMRGGENRSELRAIRSVAEIFNEKLAISNYYRSNHVGSMGIIYGMDYTDPHVEGCSTAACYPHGTSNSRRPGSGQYVPSSLVAITPYGTDQDMDVRRDQKGRALGKAGYAAPLPDTEKEFLITHGRGSCYEVTPPQQANRRAMGGEPTCQKAIYRVKVPMVTDPFDERQMEFMAGGDEWHAFDARAIATFQSLHGMPLPTQPPPLNPDANCYLQVVDARAAELYASAERYDWRSNLYAQCALQGCAVNTEDKRFHARNMAGLAVYLPEMWDFTYSGGKEKEYAAAMNNMGHKSIALLGSQPLMADGSVKMQVPCEVPLIMAGTDEQGVAIAHDSMLHSLRAGETRTCHGCHDGHSEERSSKLKGSPQERFASTQAFNTFPDIPKAVGTITFDDVKPILQSRCSSCHKDMNDKDGLLYSRIAQDYEQFDWPWARKQIGVGQRTSIEHVLIRRAGRGYKVGEALTFESGGASGKISKVGPGGSVSEIRLLSAGNNYKPKSPVQVQTAQGQGARLIAMTSVFELQRPYTSKWVARFARDSMLYWKCVGQRRDGRTDKQYQNDIDFGPEHATTATAAECRTLGQWIDLGAQR